MLSPRELSGGQFVAVKLQERTQRKLGLFFEAYALARTMPEPGRPGHEEGLQQLRRLQEPYGEP